MLIVVVLLKVDFKLVLHDADGYELQAYKLMPFVKPPTNMRRYLLVIKAKSGESPVSIPLKVN